MTDYGSRIRARRKELKMTLRDLGDRAGLSYSFLCDVERGKRRIGADNLLAVGQVLGLPMDQLMGGAAVETSGVEIQLPQSLVRFATAANIPFRRVMCLYWMQRTIMDHRQSGKLATLETVDWLPFYEAVRAFL